MTPIASLFRACFIFLIFGVVSGQVNYTIINKCPRSINVYIGGRLDSVLSTGDNTTRNLGLDPGFFYSDDNGGGTSGVGTRAGFYGDSQSHYYYLVNDPDQFNMGMSITPTFPQTGGFCVVANCDKASCEKVFSQPPMRFPPHMSNAPPSLPVYSCPYADLAYDITFCPSGSFPRAGPDLHFTVHPTSNQNQCLDVRGGVFKNGTIVQVSECNDTAAQRWVIRRGCTKIRLAGTNFCLDAGPTPDDKTIIKLWQCQDNLPSQQWYIDNGRVALAGEGLCPGLRNAQWLMDNLQWPMDNGD